MSQDKKKYLIPGAAGVSLLVTAITFTLVIISKRSDKADSVKTDQQTKELRDDPCVVLLKEYLKAFENKVGKAKLSELYAEGRAKCPKDFPEPVLQEEPKVEDIRARIFKKEEEKKVNSVNKTEGGVNKGGKSTSNTATETAGNEKNQGVASVDGSKGNNSATNSSKPAIVPQAKNNTTEIKNNSNDTKVEIVSVDEKIPQQPQFPSPSGNSTPATTQASSNSPNLTVTPSTTVTQQSGSSTATPIPQPSGNLATHPNGNQNTTIPQSSSAVTKQDDIQSNTGTPLSGNPDIPGQQPGGASNTSGTQPKPSGLNGQPTNPDLQGTNINNSSTPPPIPLTPEQLKEKQTQAKNEQTLAKNECMKMLKGIEEKSSASEMLGVFTDEQNKRILEYRDAGLLPRDYTANMLVRDHWYGKMLKHMKTGNGKEAQDACNTYVEVARASGEKVKDAVVTEKSDYKFWKAIATDNWTEATNLLKQPLFLPSFIREAMKNNTEKLKMLKELNDSQMDALWDYCKWNVELEGCLANYNSTGDEWIMTEAKAEYNRTAEKMSLLNEDIHKNFDFAVPFLIENKSHMQELDEKLTIRTPEFEKLRKDRNLGMSLIAEAVYSLEKPEDQVELLQTVRRLKKSYTADACFVDLLLSSARKRPVEDDIKEYLTYADFNKDEHLSVISEAMAKMSISGWSLLEQACIDFWKQFVSLSQGTNQTLKEDLHNKVNSVSPLKIESVGDILCKLGDKGTPLVEQSAHCINIKNSEEPSVRNEAAQVYAHAYLKMYKAVNGAGMNTLYKGMHSMNIFKSVDSQILVDLILSKVKLDNWRDSKLVELVNSNVIDELTKRLKVVREHIPENWSNFYHHSKITDSNLPNGFTLSEAHFDVIVLNRLHNFFARNLICEWKPVPATQHVTLAEVVSSFEAFNAYKLASGGIVDQALQTDFDEKAEIYINMRMQSIIDELKKLQANLSKNI